MGSNLEIMWKHQILRSVYQETLSGQRIILDEQIKILIFPQKPRQQHRWMHPLEGFHWGVYQEMETYLVHLRWWKGGGSR